MPAKHRLERLVDRRVERIDRAVAGRLGRMNLAPDRDRDGPGPLPAVRAGDAPALELDRSGHVAGAPLDDRQEVCVGDLLLQVRQGNGLAVDRIESLALQLVTELV